MSQRVSRYNWAATSLGAAAEWPSSLRTVVEVILTSGFPMVALWGPALIQIYNDPFRDLMGRRHPTGLGQAAALCWPELWHINRGLYERVFASETVTLRDQLYTVYRHGRRELAWFDVSASPLYDGGAGINGVLVTMFETTSRNVAEAALRQSEHRLGAIVRAGSYAVFRLNPDWSEVLSIEGRVLAGGTRRQSWLHTFIPPEHAAEVLPSVEHALLTRSQFELEHRMRRADGSKGWALTRIVPLVEPGGRLVEWVGTAADISDRKHAENALRKSERRHRMLADHNDVLVRELQHRTRNLLAVVTSVVRSTASGTDSLHDFQDRLLPRLGALSRVSGLLSRQDSEGRINFDELLRAELLGHGALIGEGVRLEGPRELRLPSRTAQTLALAIHELATNALKYGALAQNSGRLTVIWGEEERAGVRHLQVVWQESDIAVHRQADKIHRGFGQTLIEEALPYQFNAEVRYELSSSGVLCSISLPLDGLE